MSRQITTMLAQFDAPGSLLHAAEKLTEQGYEKFDAHSPFPVHGLDKAMKLRSSPVTWIVFLGGLTGCSGALLLQGWVHTIDYPLVIGGKPFFSLPAFIPITFELTVLLSSFSALFGMLGLNRLPQWYNRIFHSSQFQRMSNDGFFISIESSDPKFDAQRTRDFLQSLGAKNVELVSD